MTIKKCGNNLNHIFKNKNRDCVLDVYLARQRRHIHITFDRLLMSLENSDDILDLLLSE